MLQFELVLRGKIQSGGFWASNVFSNSKRALLSSKRSNNRFSFFNYLLLLGIPTKH